VTSPVHTDSVRLAMPAEASAITGVQRAYLASLPGLAAVLDDLDEATMTRAWFEAITRPPLATYRVLVALDHNDGIVGFAAIGPSDDIDADETDALVAEFCVQPDHQDTGHEDRLMHAIADTLRADGFVRATWWVLADDDRTRAFLTASGWAPDGGHQEIGDEDDHLRVKQVRLHTSLVDQAGFGTGDEAPQTS